MSEVEGIVKITQGSTKKGKPFQKVTIGDKLMYDWTGCCDPSLDGSYCKAIYNGGEYPEVIELKPIKQTTVNGKQEYTTKHIVGFNGSLAVSPTYLACKLAVDLVKDEQIAVDKKLKRFEEARKAIIKVLKG